MTGMLAPWWRQRTRREQWLIAILAVLLVMVIVWLGLLRPLAMARAEAAGRHDRAQAALLRVQAMTAPIADAERRSRAARGTPLAEAIGRSAEAAGLTLASLESNAGAATLRIAAVRPVALIGWLARLEQADGLIIDRMTASRNPDATVAVMLVVRRGAAA